MLLVHFGLLQPVVFRKSTELGKNLFEKLQAGTVIRNIKKEENKIGLETQQTKKHKRFKELSYQAWLELVQWFQIE